ncbi:LysR family transcriptional regulator [Massilia sp. WF1]|nr:LysR family transcriptional regulator [Massilia sp. WG5]KLU37547.1 LysR family transcriptional regulator [Massilia sp. WF1]
MPLPMRMAGDQSDALASSFATTYAGVVAFIAVVHEGSFARAAERLGVGRSAVSRSVQKLETQLDTRLFLRTTRSTTLTAEGEVFFENCRPGVERIMQSVEEMHDLRTGTPRGSLRISATVGFGRKVVAPLLKEFHARYPDITLDLTLDDRPTDFTSDRIDVAFRNGRMDDGQIVAKKLVPMQMLVCASPEYARRHGLPRTPGELAAHPCINFRFASGRVFEWEFKVDGLVQKHLPKGWLCFNDADLVLQAVLDGEGIAQMAGYQICEHLRSGRLLPALAQHAPDDRGHYLCYLSRHHMPMRMRVFIDYMTDRIRALDLHCLDALLATKAGETHE